jgi:hypothetical protein
MKFRSMGFLTQRISFDRHYRETKCSNIFVAILVLKKFYRYLEARGFDMLQYI